MIRCVVLYCVVSYGVVCRIQSCQYPAEVVKRGRKVVESEVARAHLHPQNQVRSGEGQGQRQGRAGAGQGR